MILTYAKVMGLLFLTMGILGFMPGAAPHGELFGLFLMDTAHNILFLMTGLVLLAVGLTNQWESARRVTLGVAAVYGLLTLLGFVIPSHLVMGMPMNMSDDILHLAITASALMFGLPERYAYPQ